MDIIAKEMKEKDVFDALWKLILAEDGTPGMIIFSMDEGDIKRIMASPYQMVGTDASSVCTAGPFGLGKPHPRHFGTYPRVLGKYVREENVIRLEEAIRKITSLPAAKFKLKDRGVLREGAYADLTIINPDTITDRGNTLNPRVYPKGIEYVAVNGKLVVAKAKHTGETPGKVLRRE